MPNTQATSQTLVNPSEPNSDDELESPTSHPNANPTQSSMKRLLSALLFCAVAILSTAQSTYTIGSTEYYYDRTYSTTGLPMVKRSEANRAAFLKSKGYNAVPSGYEVDHIIPLSQGGTDDPSNMQLLTIEEHDRKTAIERARTTNTTYHSMPYYSSNYTPTPQYSNPTRHGGTSRTIHTGPRGGKYYINSNGNKTYIRRK